MEQDVEVHEQRASCCRVHEEPDQKLQQLDELVEIHLDPDRPESGLPHR